MKWRAWIGGWCLGSLLAAHAVAEEVADLASPAARISLAQAQRSGSVAHARDGVAQQRYAFQPAAHPWLVLRPPGEAWNWSGRDELRVRVQNAMPWAVTLDVEIEGVGQRLRARVGVPAGPAQTLVVPLHATSPRAQGMQAGPPMPFDDRGQLVLLASTVDGELDRRRVRAVRLGVPAPQATQALWFGGVSVVPDSPTLRDAYAGIVDRYGQYARGRWPEKIDSDAALRAAVAAGHQVARPVLVDRQDGRLDGHVNGKTGWFHAQKRDGRWRLVTPEGRAFFSLGVNAVTADGGRSYIEGRGFMFAGLPPDSGEWAAFHGRGDHRRAGQRASEGIGYNHGRWFDFYAANLYRIGGRGWLAAWRARTLDRLQAWGFNTIGNWSDAALGQAHRLPYTHSINIAGDYANVASGFDYWGRMPDPFDPRFAQAVERAVAKASAEARDDPWLLGYFADNELAWAGTGPQGRWGLALGTLAGDANSPAKQAFIARLRKRYAGPETLAAAWGVDLTSWAGLGVAGYAAPTPNEAHPAIARDYSQWLRAYADAYFRRVAEAIRRHDPHHLFLGSRFAVSTPEAVAPARSIVTWSASTSMPTCRDMVSTRPPCTRWTNRC